MLGPPHVGFQRMSSMGHSYPHRSPFCVFVLTDNGFRSVPSNDIKLPLWDNVQEVKQVNTTYNQDAGR